MISFDSPFHFFTPSRFPHFYRSTRESFVVAPFWADVDSRRTGQIRYQVLTATNQNANATIEQVNRFISQVVNESFSGLWLLVAEWRDVHPYPHGSFGESSFLTSYTNLVSIE